MTSDTFKQTILPLQSHMQLLAERMLGSETEAEDVVQEVFLKFWPKPIARMISQVYRLSEKSNQIE